MQHSTASKSRIERGCIPLRHSDMIDPQFLLSNALNHNISNMGGVLSSLPRRSSSPLSLNQSRSLENPNGPKNSASPKHVNDHEHPNTSSQAHSPTNLKSNIQAQAPREESTITTSTILSAHISPAQQQRISTLIQAFYIPSKLMSP